MTSFKKENERYYGIILYSLTYYMNIFIIIIYNLLFFWYIFFICSYEKILYILSF
ncbi:hypothetical protein PFFCH_04942 [Plasmodium falciparum FCH/4]|uniref:Uncharacterized protein n=1 Tax=Plasmodium falciparum FCH/4 TaxID=1036724 RepID=A0A024VG04_PLAFA|nr:hypothetical protein PFFCH_04942 [Plasmodium falciparum FCH/4]